MEIEHHTPTHTHTYMSREKYMLKAPRAVWRPMRFGPVKWVLARASVPVTKDGQRRTENHHHQNKGSEHFK